MPVPVVVTGADTPLGTAVVEVLRGDGAEVRATVRTRAAAAQVPRPVAVMDLSDPLRFGAVLEGAHTVVHLDPAPMHWVVEAAEDTSVRRLVLIRPVGMPGPDVSAATTEGLEVVVLAGDVSRVDPVLVRSIVEADRRR